MAPAVCLYIKNSMKVSVLTHILAKSIGQLTYESSALPIALRGPANIFGNKQCRYNEGPLYNQTTQS